MINYILPAIIAAAIIFAIYRLRKRRKNGCSSCSACAYSKQCGQTDEKDTTCHH